MSWKRRLLLIVSVGAHVVAGIVLVVYSVLQVEELEPPR